MSKIKPHIYQKKAEIIRWSTCVFSPKEIKIWISRERCDLPGFVLTRFLCRKSIKQDNYLFNKALNWNIFTLTRSLFSSAITFEDELYLY